MQMKAVIAVGVFLLAVIIAAEFLLPGQEMFVSGRLIIPLIDLSLAGDGRHPIHVETETEGPLEFRILKSDVDRILKSTQSFGINDPPAKVSVKFRKSLFGRRHDASIVDFKEGWIQTPK